MNKLIRIINLYANSLYEFSKENNIQKEIFHDSMILSDHLKKYPKMLLILTSVRIKNNLKIDMVSEIYSHAINKYLLNFIYILINNNKIFLVKKILKQLKNYYYKDNNIQEVKIVSAKELSDQERDKLKIKIENLFSTKIIPSYLVDEKIIGGIIVKSEFKLCDMSIISKLQQMKKCMIAN